MSKNGWGSSDPVEETKGGTNQSTYTTGDILYSDSANSLAKLGIGSTDEILTVSGGVPAWAAASGLPGGSGITFLASQTASASTSIDFSSFIDSTYNVYMFVLEDIAPASDQVRLAVRTSTDGGSSYDSGASDYAFASVTSGGSGAQENYDAAADSIIILGQGGGSPYNLGNATNETSSGIVFLIKPSDATYTKVIHTMSGLQNSSGTPTYSSGGGWRISAADVDAVRFLFTSGNIASGTFRLYGMVTPS